MPNRVNLLMPFLTSTQKCLTIFQTFFCIVILDLTTTLYSLKQAQQLFYLKKYDQRTRQPPTPIIRREGTARTAWDQNPKVDGAKIEKCERVCLGFRGPYF